MEEEYLENSLFSALKRSRIVNGYILDVTHMNNHHLDISLYNGVAKKLLPELEKINPDVFITAEASGIGLTTVIASNFGTNLIYAKKSLNTPIVMQGKEVLQRTGISPTKGSAFNFYISKDVFNGYDSFFVVDDFLRSGKTLESLISLGVEAGLEYRGAFCFVSLGKTRITLERNTKIPIFSAFNIEKIVDGTLFIDEFFSEKRNIKMRLEKYDFPA